MKKYSVIKFALSMCLGSVVLSPVAGVAYAGDPVTVFFAGDSTLHSRVYSDWKSTNAEVRCLGSWCDELANYVKGDVRIRNYALSGLSTRSYLEDGHWELLVMQVNPGDFVYVQFGHNDQKRETRHYAAADGAYRENLRRFASEVRARGGHPVFGTSMVRRIFGADGKVADGLGDYPETVRKLGRELDVPVVDFNAFSRALVEAADPATSLTWYRASVDGKDFTHPTKLGAKVFAKAFVEDVKSHDLELARIFR